MNKQELRERIKEAKHNIDEAYRNKAGREVMQRVEELAEFKEAKRVLLYHALPDELPTTEMLNGWKDEKELFLPVVVGGELEIKRYNPNTLTKGAFGIKEPVGESVDADIIDLVIVPGVAFDRNGNRLGRGKGFYDKLLARCKGCFIGVCYAMQIVESVPALPHDIRMKYIITDKEIIL